MNGGYMEKVLWVDLTRGLIRQETFDEFTCKNFIGGYGAGAWQLYRSMPAGVDPLGPENTLGFVTGPLTGTATPTGTRFTVIARSPLTLGWGDASSAGYFGPNLKKAGYDAIFFTGQAPHPVYLFLDDATAELRPASELWGKDCYEVEDWVKANLGDKFEVACIGPAGEKQVLFASVMTAKGRSAARSGLGAVMGSKKLKCIAVRGTGEVPIADPVGMKATVDKYHREINAGTGASTFYRNSGTPGYISVGIKMGDSPIANWKESPKAFGDPDILDFDEIKKYRIKRKTCWHCPIGCWSLVKAEFDGVQTEGHQPEYESASAFGSLVLNSDYPGTVRANELCNRYGLDTISAGGVAAFAIECYLNGLIRPEQTGGIPLAWGDPKVVTWLIEQIAFRQGIGDLLAEGVARASKVIGPESEPFAIHVGGQELPMHDPRFEPGLGLIYKLDATPGRHTIACQFTVPSGFPTTRPAFGDKRTEQIGRGHYMKEALCLNHTMNAAGVCLFGYCATNIPFVPDFLSVVTGTPFTVEDMLLAGERIANIRQAFTIREGLNPVQWSVPARAYGQPPLTDGPTAGIEVQVDQMGREFLEDMGWTQDAAIPTPDTLNRLGLSAIVPDFWKGS